MNRIRMLLALVCTIFLLVTFYYAMILLPQLVQAQTATATISCFNYPKDVTIMPNGAYSYITNAGNSTVSVIDTAMNTIPATVTGLEKTPYGIAVTPVGAPIFFPPTPSAFPTPTPTPSAFPTPTPTPSAFPTPTPTPSASPTPTPTSTATPTPSLTPSGSTVSATTGSGATVELAISGNITGSQMSSVTIATNQSANKSEVSFIVTGESGTTGFGNITIPVSSVTYGTTPAIYIDGQPAQEQGYRQDSNNYYIWYTTHFSTHQISIVFTVNSSSTQPSFIQEAFNGFVTVVAIIAVAAFVLVLRKRKTLKVQRDGRLEETV